MPPWRRNIIYGYIVGGCAVLAHFTLNCKKYNQRFFKPGSIPSIPRIIGLASIQAVHFALFLAGLLYGIYGWVLLHFREAQPCGVPEDVLQNTGAGRWADPQALTQPPKEYSAGEYAHLRAQ